MFEYLKQRFLRKPGGEMFPPPLPLTDEFLRGCIPTEPVIGEPAKQIIELLGKVEEWDVEDEYLHIDGHITGIYKYTCTHEIGVKLVYKVSCVEELCGEGWLTEHEATAVIKGIKGLLQHKRNKEKEAKKAEQAKKDEARKQELLNILKGENK